MAPKTQADFLTRYRAISDEQLREIASRRYDLVDEAAVALDIALAERGIAASSIPTQSLPPSRQDLNAEEREKLVAECSALWNGAVSKSVQLLFAAQALVFAISVYGASGQHGGVLLLLPVAGVLSFAMQRFGKSYARDICADDNRVLEEKRAALVRTSRLLWPALLLSATLGSAIGAMLRGA